MPNARTHFVIGMAVGAALNLANQLTVDLHGTPKEFDLGEFALCALAAGAAAMLPDILEPADSPRHRKFFHSVAAVIIVVSVVSGRPAEQLSDPAKFQLRGLCLSYLSHLALDAGTPMSLPLFGFRL